MEASLLLGAIDGAGEDKEGLTDDVLRNHLEKKAATSPETIKLERLDSIVKSELKMNMKDVSSRSRMLSLFVDYTAIIKRHGVGSRNKQQDRRHPRPLRSSIDQFSNSSTVRPGLRQKRVAQEFKRLHGTIYSTVRSVRAFGQWTPQQGCSYGNHPNYAERISVLRNKK